MRRLALLVVLAAFVWFLPAIASHPVVLPRVVALLVPDFTGRVAIGSASLGWLSPIRLQNVQLVDAEGQPLLDCSTLEVHRTLASLILDRKSPVDIRTHNSRVSIILYETTTNWEQALRPLWQASGSAPPPLHIAATDGTIVISDAETGRSWSVRGVNVSLESARACRAKINGEFAEQANSLARSSRVEVAATWSADQLEIETHADNVPTDLLSAAVRRWQPELQASGRALVRGTCRWDRRENTLAIAIEQLAASDLRISHPRWLNDEFVALKQLTGGGKIILRGHQLTLEQVRLASDLGTLDTGGTLQLHEASIVQLLGRPHNYRLAADLDLARWAAAMPRTLRIRPDTVIRSGTLHAEISCDRQQTGGRWTIAARLPQLNAQQGQQTIRWDQPLEAQLQIAEDASGWRIEALHCQSEFLTLDGRGDLSAGQLSMRAELRRLSEQLSQLIQLDESELDGTLAADVQWSRGDSNSWSATAQASVGRLALKTPAGQWNEPSLHGTIELQGAVEQNRLRRLDTARLDVQAGDDRLQLVLTEGVDSPSLDSAFPLDCRASGGLASWLARLRPWLPRTDVQLRGQVDLQALASCNRRQIDIRSSRLHIRELEAQQSNWTVRESEVIAELAGVWERQGNQLHIRRGMLTSSSVAVSADECVLSLDSLSSGSGQLAYRADLNRAAAAFLPADRLALFGMATGNIRWASEDATIALDASTRVDGFAIAVAMSDSDNASVRPASRSSRLRPVVYEKQVDVQLRCNYARREDKTDVRQLALSTPWLTLSLNGTSSDVLKLPRVDLQGTLSYDWDQFRLSMQSTWPANLSVSGRGEQPIRIRGPLLQHGQPSGDPRSTPHAAWPPPDLTIQAAVDWSSIQYDAFRIGPGVCRAELAGSQVRFEPLDVTVNDGRLRLVPRLDLSVEPAVVALQEPAQLDSLSLTPAMCRQWLKYVTPLLADATEAQGRLSLELDELHIPMTDTKTARAAGQLSIHQGQVGPGSNIRPLLALIEQVIAAAKGQPLAGVLGGAATRWVTLPAQKVHIQLRDGRVQHDRLEMLVGDEASVLTSGSVGLDQSLDLTAAVSLGQLNQRLGMQPDQRFTLPIRGRLSQPQIDGNIIGQLIRRSLGGAAENALQKELEKGLQKLFGPRP